MTVQKPAITWRGASPANITAGRGGYALEFLVLHIMEGSLEGCAVWFNDPAARASTHFGVGKDGRIFQFVDLADQPFAHGAVEVDQAHAPAVIRANWGVNPNRLGVGIEHEGFSGDVMTAAQFEASTRLAAWLFDSQILPGVATDVAVDRAHVLRHGEISPSSRPKCPGFTEAAISAYIARVKALVEGVAPPPVIDRLRPLQDVVTLQSRSLRQTAAALTIQANNLDAAISASAK